MTARAARSISKIILGSLVLANTTHAYPIEYFQHQEFLLPQTTHFQEKSIVQPPKATPETFEIELPVFGPTMIPGTSSPVTRADFVKSVVDGMFPEGIPATCFEQLSPSDYWLLFRDVPVGADYGPQLCAAMIMGFVKGYSDVTFRPVRPINFAEASKILAKAHGLASDSADPSVEWYEPYVEAMRERGALPTGIQLDDYVTPDDMAFMIARLQLKALLINKIDDPNIRIFEYSISQTQRY